MAGELAATVILPADREARPGDFFWPGPARLLVDEGVSLSNTEHPRRMLTPEQTRAAPWSAIAHAKGGASIIRGG